MYCCSKSDKSRSQFPFLIILFDFCFGLFLLLRDRGVSRAQWRRSFGASPLTSKEDVRQKENLSANGSGSVSGCNREQNADADWPALHANYTYLMSCDLIESCRSLNGEMSWDNGDLEHHHLLAPVDATTVLSGSLPFAANRSVAAVGCQTDAAEVTIAGESSTTHACIIPSL